jgi:glycosyltransferase involved in cell wall biosynthesis
MARILWMSDGPERPTGFGLVTGEICARLASLGHAVTILAWWEAAPGVFAGIDVIPCPVSPREASAVLVSTLLDVRADILVTLADIPWVSYIASPDVRSFLDARRIPWCLYYPMDGARPDGTMPEAWGATLRQADLPVAMSRFGTGVSARSGIQAACIPHGCDTGLFRPPPDKDAAKRAAGYDGRFVVLADMRNHRRKMLPRLLDIFRLFAAGKDDVVLLLNTNIVAEEDADSYCYDLQADIAALGMSDIVRLSRAAGAGPLTLPQVAALYDVADIHLLTSYGEGFGLPTLQAAASGVVPVAGAHSANVELLGRHGLAVPCDGTVLDEFGMARPLIDRRQAAEALEALYRDRLRCARLSGMGRNFALTLDWTIVVAAWETLLSGADLRLDRPAPAQTPLTAHLRPTGHDAATLPPPRLTIPVRPPGFPGGRGDAAILVHAACAPALRRLTTIFPGLSVRTAADWQDVPLPVLRDRLNGIMMVVDPQGGIHPGLPEICRQLGLVCIGAPDRSAARDDDSLLALARQLLTDPVAMDRRLGTCT